MTKNLFLVLLLTVQIAFAQIISKDSNFASNGVAEIPSNSITNSYQMVQNSNGEIYFTYNMDVATGVTHGFVTKLTPNGTPDPAFGNNGTVKLPSEPSMTQIKLQADGKLLIFSLLANAQILRLLPNGQIDPTFGTNGISQEIDADHDDYFNSYEFILQNGKILVHGIRRGQDPHHTIYRLNADGNLDNSFGNNGSVTTKGNLTGRTFVFIDNQSNIITFSDNISVIEKFDPDGHPIANFGNNGTVQISINGTSVGDVGDVFLDSNNKIVFSTFQNNNMFRLNQDGSLDNTFNYDLQTSLGLPSGPRILNITEKDGYYYIGGAAGDSMYNNNYFISKLNPNGSLNSTFGYHIETNYDETGLISKFFSVTEMIINNNNIIVKGNNNIVKYLLNSGTLSTADITKAAHTISFENPVKQNLVYQSKEKVNKIEIYSLDGKAIKTIKNSGTQVSELPKGIYITKVTFESGSSISKKLIKN
ncbi:T9SS type A sorting domain-containing protein [Chryseobacterium sp. MYb328]|uniref:T9SS type A sorting domain-containing protein n=1 Tax=Chryseobacterium sp. MYb328 TaxID=2745231 RepID=UPI0030AA7A60